MISIGTLCAVHICIQSSKPHLSSFGCLGLGRSHHRKILASYIDPQAKVPKLLFTIPWLASMRLASKLKGTCIA